MAVMLQRDYSYKRRNSIIEFTTADREKIAKLWLTAMLKRGNQ
ncbi:hypothetical protein [Periweissella beninensis]|nr:hypothetical protein [Periweissella beninensis]